MLGAILPVAAGIFGAISKVGAARKQRDLLARQRQENENWYQRRYNEDSTQRADAQNALRVMREALRERSREALATTAVTGGTDAAVAAQKASANKALGSTIANIAAAGDARKDAIEQQYMENKANANAQLGQSYGIQGQNIAGAMGGVSQTLPELLEAFQKK